MADDSPRAKHHHWRRELVELAALFIAVTVADTVAKTVVNAPDGPATLVICAVALAGTAGWHTWWARRHAHTPPPAESDGPHEPGTEHKHEYEHEHEHEHKHEHKHEYKHAHAGAPENSLAPEVGAPGQRTERTERAGRTGGTALWRMRATVREEPGSLARLCTALADARVDILALQTHPLGEATVDEFLLRAPEPLDPRALARLVTRAGGYDTWAERADAHDLVDTPTRMLGLATRTALDAAELPLALRQLLGRCAVRSVPAARPAPGTGSVPDGAPAEGSLEGTVLRLPDPSGGEIVLERPQLPFTPTEFARARALVELDARLGQRMPHGRDPLTLPEGQALTIRRAGIEDLEAALAMHGRCSKETLTQRYHGPVGDADRYLRHLLSPRFGRTLAVETASGTLIALGHLLWDGEETEVALLVEDAWQRRGVGGELLRRLTGMADEARCESVYAVTQASNTGMVAAMRGLGLPLDYQVEEGTLVVTAALAPASVAPR